RAGWRPSRTARDGRRRPRRAAPQTHAGRRGSGRAAGTGRPRAARRRRRSWSRPAWRSPRRGARRRPPGTPGASARRGRRPARRPTAGTGGTRRAGPPPGGPRRCAGSAGRCRSAGRAPRARTHRAPPARRRRAATARETAPAGAAERCRRGATPTSGRGGRASRPGRARGAPPAAAKPPPGARSSSERVGAHLAGPDPDHLLHRSHPDLPVADLAGPGRLGDRVDDAVHPIVVGEHLDLDLRDEVDLVLGPAVDLGVPALTAEPLHVARRESVHADLAERLLDLVKLERLHDRDDELHGSLLRRPSTSLARLRAPPGPQPAAARFVGAAFLAGAALRFVAFLAAPWDGPRDPETAGVLFLAASTEALSASIRSTTRAGAASGTTSISSPATFFSTTSRRASRYSSR